MKKLVLVVVAMLATGVMYAQTYQHSVGLVVGSLNGVSYKTFLGENFALQTDLAFGVVATQGGTEVATGEVRYWDFQVNPNAYYQKEVASFSWGTLSAYGGGGLSIGMAKFLGSYSMPLMGKWGINAIAGVECGVNNLPIVFALDFRPGYGMLFYGEYGYTMTVNTFDWALAASVRYVF
jgi:hypothetical protein